VVEAVLLRATWKNGPVPPLLYGVIRSLEIEEDSPSMNDDSRDRRDEQAPPIAFRSLIRFGNVTYRIGRLRHGEYEVVRILDDVRIGTFQSEPQLTVTSSSIHPAFILSIARAAARSARTSWVKRVAQALRRRTISGVIPRVGADAPSDPEPSEEEEIVTLQKPEEKG
jgi:hypothetical protein